MQLLIEILCEELPASFVRPALKSLADGVCGLLEGVEHGAVRTHGTPRRLAVVIDDVAEARPREKTTVTGPPAERAFVDGEPTKAALGFARGKGVGPEALHIVDGPKGPVAAVTIEIGGERAADLITEGLGEVVLGIPFKKSMEWGNGGVRFARPLHRISVVLGGRTLSGKAAGIPFGNETLGHRLNPGPVVFTDEATWLEGLREHHVEADLAARESRIRELLEEAAGRLGCDPIQDDELLEEVLHLVEWPVLVLGSFDDELLDLPSRLLIKSMKSHQRYFPTFQGGDLASDFVVISNNPFGDEARIANGNANVLRARFYDARFFFAEDQKRALEDHGRQLEKMRWIRGLGTVSDKGDRLSDLGAEIAGVFGADAEVVSEAASLCKADLATLMVGEFPDLQGHMGRLYALAAGRREGVALAIEEHYRPAFAGDVVATTPESAALAVADRLDTLAGCFGIGMVPKGSGDPQGLRRAAQGVLATLVAHGIRTPLEDLYRTALTVFDRHARHQPEAYSAWGHSEDLEGITSTLVEFTTARFRADAVRDGVSGDLVDAVLEVGSTDTLDRHARLDALTAMARSDDFVPIMRTFKRVLNISRDADVPVPTQAPAGVEADLLEAAHTAERAVEDAVSGLDYPAAFQAALALNAPVAAFFDGVLVEDPDPDVRARRLGILAGIAATFLRLADFSRISTR